MNVLITVKAATGDSKVTYTINSENNITAFATAKEAKSAPDVERFASAKELAKLAEQWPAARLVDIWNALPGVVPAKRFTSRKTAVVRVWAAMQNLGPNAGAQPPRVGPKRAKAPQQASPQEKTPPAREGSKKAEVLALLRREGGVTLPELMTATGWQAHSVRGFLSGALGKKMGLTVESAKREDGTRSWRCGIRRSDGCRVHGRQTEGQRDLDTDRLILPRNAAGRRRGRIREISSVAAVQNFTPGSSHPAFLFCRSGNTRASSSAWHGVGICRPEEN